MYVFRLILYNERYLSNSSLLLWQILEYQRLIGSHHIIVKFRYARAKHYIFISDILAILDTNIVCKIFVGLDYILEIRLILHPSTEAITHR